MHLVQVFPGRVSLDCAALSPFHFLASYFLSHVLTVELLALLKDRVFLVVIPSVHCRRDTIKSIPRFHMVRELPKSHSWQHQCNCHITRSQATCNSRLRPVVPSIQQRYDLRSRRKCFATCLQICINCHSFFSPTSQQQERCA